MGSVGIWRRVGASAECQTFCSGGRAHSRRQWIARKHRHVCDGAALNALGRPSAAFWIIIAFRITVIGGIGVNEAADRAMLFGELWLQPAPARSVAGDDDLAFDADSALLERIIVGRHSIIDINNRCSDVSVAR